MDRFVVKRPRNHESSSSSNNSARVELDDLPWDPSDRVPILSYHPNQIDEIRRAYLLKGPCQPLGHEFPQRNISGCVRRFRVEWFKQYEGWLEYSVKTNKAYCLFCYLFPESGQKDAFVKNGFDTWNKVERFSTHVSGVNSLHNKARKRGEDLLKQSQSIHVAFEKQTDLIRESQKERLGLNPEIETGRGKNQELSLARAGDTRWSSHEKTLLRLLALYPTVIDVLDYIEECGESDAHKSQANGLHEYIKTFNFAFFLHLMKHVLGVTNILCEALQRKDQDILNAVGLVRSTKEELKRYRLEGFDSLLKDVTSFCDKYDIEMVNMEDEYVDPKNRRKKTNITNRHHYVVENFNTVLDRQIQELDNRFNEVTTDLLTFMSSLNPSSNFSAFNKLNLLKLAEMYPYDFSFDEKDKLMYELGHYIMNVKEDERFGNLNGLGELAKKMVMTNKHIDFPLVYRLIKLSLVLPVATATVERSFSSMKHVKTELRNRMGDEYMNDACICYIERELFQQVTIDNVMERFQKMKARREQL